MKDPVALTLAATAGGAASASLGAFIGIPVEAFIAGLIGGLVALFLLPPDASGKRPMRGLRFYLWLGGSVASSVAVAGFLGPLTAAWLNAPSISDHLEVLGFSFVWGAGAQTLLVSSIAALRRRIDQLGGNGP